MKLSLARALAHRPRLLILDEAFPEIAVERASIDDYLLLMAKGERA